MALIPRAVGARQPEKQEKDPLETILQGLQIASAAFGIGSNIQKLKAQGLQLKQAELESQGGISDKDILASKAQSVAEGTEGAIGFRRIQDGELGDKVFLKPPADLSNTLRGLQIQNTALDIEAKTGRGLTPPTSSQPSASAIPRGKIAQESEKRDLEIEKSRRSLENIDKKVSEDLAAGAESITGLESLIKQLESDEALQSEVRPLNAYIPDFAQEGKAPFGIGEKSDRFAKFEAERAQLYNKYKKFISGAAVSDKEKPDLLKGFPTSDLSPGKFIAKAKAAIENAKRLTLLRAISEGAAGRVKGYPGFVQKIISDQLNEGNKLGVIQSADDRKILESIISGFKPVSETGSPSKNVSGSEDEILKILEERKR